MYYYIIRKEKMQMYIPKKCSICGASLDPGERCDCQTGQKERYTNESNIDYQSERRRREDIDSLDNGMDVGRKEE